MEAKDEQILCGDPPESPSGVTGKDITGEAKDLEAEADVVEAGVEGFPRPCTSWERRAGPSSSEESQAFGSNDETDEVKWQVTFCHTPRPVYVDLADWCFTIVVLQEKSRESQEQKWYGPFR